MGWAVVKISATLKKYPTFEDIFSYFNEQNKYKIRVSVHCRSHTKKLINIKLKKLSILAIKCTFFGQNLFHVPEPSFYSSTWDICITFNATLIGDWLLHEHKLGSFQPKCPPGICTFNPIPTRQGHFFIIVVVWTMSDMVKYRAAIWSFLKLTALVFYHV